MNSVIDSEKKEVPNEQWKNDGSKNKKTGDQYKRSFDYN